MMNLIMTRIHGKAHILYSTRGVEINIENDNIENTTFYQNYYFTNYIKSLVKDGIVKFKDVDLVEQVEIERRKDR